MLDGLHQHLGCPPCHSERPRPYGLWSNACRSSRRSRVPAKKDGGEQFHNGVFPHRLFVAEVFSERRAIDFD